VTLKSDLIPGERTLRQRTKHAVLVLLVGLAAILVPILFRAWKAAGERGGQGPAEPFRIAGNLYFIGASDVSVFLITGPEGHILLDGGYRGHDLHQRIACS
jgi:hypothetical protein